MTKIILEDLTIEQRDLLFTELLAEQAAMAEPASPNTPEGENVLGVVTDLLLGNVDDGWVSDLIDQFIIGVEMGLDETFMAKLSDCVYDFQAALETDVLPQALSTSECLGDSSLSNTCNQLDQRCLSLIGKLLDDPSESEAFLAMREELTICLPDLMYESVTWRIDMAKVTQTILSHVAELLTDTVIPNVSKNICLAEAEGISLQMPNKSQIIAC